MAVEIMGDNVVIGIGLDHLILEKEFEMEGIGMGCFLHLRLFREREV